MKRLHFLQSKGAYIVLYVAGIVMIGFSQSTLTVNVDQATNVISKEMYGVLTERLGSCITGGLYVGKSSTIPNFDGMRKDIIAGFKEAGVGSILYPGGCAGNSYNWQPANQSNDLGTDQYMELCDSVGSIPYLCGHPTSGDATSNLNWVTYVNNNTSHPNWYLKYFKIGNEVWGCGGNMTEATYEPQYTANYNVLKNPINGKKLFLVAGTDLIGRYAWTDTMLKHIASQIDGIETHDYIYHPSDIQCINFTGDQYFNVCNAAGEGQIGPRLTQIIQILDKYDSAKRIKIIEDEWGDWLMHLTSDAWMQQITVMDALSTAIQLHLFMSHADRILITSLAQGINVIHSLFLTRKSDGVLVKTPAFYVYKMFVPHHTANAKWAPIALTSEKITAGGYTQSVVSAGTSVDSLGRVNISLSNIDTLNSRTVQVTLNSSKSSYTIDTAEVITGPAKSSYNDFGKAEVVNIQPLAASNVTLSGKSLTVKLPPMSIAMVVLTPPVSNLIGKSAAFNQAGAAFSIRCVQNRDLLLTSSVKRETPATISLYGIDGKTLLYRTSKIFGAGKNAFVIRSNAYGNGVCIAKISGTGFNFSKKVIVAR